MPGSFALISTRSNSVARATASISQESKKQAISEFSLESTPTSGRELPSPAAGWRINLEYFDGDYAVHRLLDPVVLGKRSSAAIMAS